MGSLSGLLNSARNALLSDQIAINTTAQNIANQNTVGYTRREVNWTENDTVAIHGIDVGRGATAKVSSTRDSVLDRSVQQATDTSAASSTRLSSLQSTQSLFAIDSSGNDSSGINSAISNFFTNVSGWAADPTSSSARSLTLSAAGTVATAFRRTSAALTSQQGILNQRVSDDVTAANTLLNTIAQLNGQIASSGGTQADSLLDQRTLAIEQLSKYIDVQHVIGESTDLTLSTSEGTLLVGANKVYPLSTGVVNGQTHVFAAANQGSLDITNQISGGSVAGAIKVRDQDIPAVQAQLDTLAYSFANSVNAQNAAGKDATGAAGQNVFTVNATAAGAAANLAVSMTDPSGLAGASTSEASGGSSNANAMLALQSANTTGGKTFAGAFSTMLSGLGTTVNSAQADTTADTAILSQLTTQRDTITGVSLDTEAANLTQYQRSYQAAAKLMAILNQMLATAINLGTNTPVS